MRRIAKLGVSLLCLMACRGTPQPARADGGGGAGASMAPRPQWDLRTTDGAIALGNLQAQIDGELRLGAYRPLTVKQRAGIAELIATRGQFLGRIADYERAQELTEALVRDTPADPRAYLARAKARATFHRFAAALDD